jgi:RNA polymerase sigma factor (sigma-70 family)
MEQPDDSTVFREFKERYQSNRVNPPTEAEEAFLARMVPSLARMARSKLTNDVRRLFDTNDITSTVMRRVIGRVRAGKLKLETEGQFKSLLSTMTKHVISDKHDYLHGLLRDQTRNLSLNMSTRDDETGSAAWDLTAEDDLRTGNTSSHDAQPIDDMILAEKIQSLNELCSVIRKYLGSPDDWELFRLRFFEELSWQSIGQELGITADAARMRMKRNIEDLRPKLQQFEKWLSEKP